MDELDGDRRPQRIGVASPEGLAGEQRDVGAQPLAGPVAGLAQAEMVLDHLGEQGALAGSSPLREPRKLAVERLVHRLHPVGAARKGLALHPRAPVISGPGVERPRDKWKGERVITEPRS